MKQIPQVMPIKERRKYFQAYDWFVKRFPADSVDLELAALNINRLVEEFAQPLRGVKGDGLTPHEPHYKAKEKLGTAQRYHRFYRGEWYRDVRLPCEVWMVPNRDQGLVHTEILAALLKEKYEWLADFTLKCYEIHDRENSSDEFYVELSTNYKGHDSLYVPYDTFLAGDAGAIIKRNSEYLKGYTKSDEAWDGIKTDPVTINFFAEMEKMK